MTSSALTVGLVLVPDFTMLAFAAFVDTLRLAADEGDRSRPIHCRWTVMSEGGHPVRASNGVSVQPSAGLLPPDGFDYLVVVGGTLHRGPEVGRSLAPYLRRAAEAGVPLVGLCTGGFVLARAGLMRGRRCCVSWFHHDELAAEFPDMKVVADELFVFDRDRITCAGGTSVVHLASALVERHLGPGRSHKGLRVMLEDRARGGRSPQPPAPIPGLSTVGDPRVRRAMLLIERNLTRRLGLDEVARTVGTTSRQLARLFEREAGHSPAAFRDRLRLHRARGLVREGRRTMTDIAAECGFADAGHFSRRYRRLYGASPTADRRLAGPDQAREDSARPAGDG